MINLLPTESITFVKKSVTGKDNIGDPIYTDSEFTVKGCLVSPLTTAEMVGPLSNLQRQSYTVHLPKTFESELPADVILRGKRFRVVFESGAVTSSPLAWDRHVVVEAVENG